MLRQEEIINVSKLNAFDRYKYFIKKVADYEEAWTLGDDNNYAIAEVGGNKMISLWSAEDFVIKFKEGVWKNYLPKSISLDKLEAEIFPLIQVENYLINVFPVNDKVGFAVSLEEFIRDLNTELEKYE